MSKRIALATCRNLPDWEVDDRPFEAALRARGAEVHNPAWDDPEFDWAACDGCLIRTTWDYTPRSEAFLAWADRVAAQIPFFNPPDVIRWNIDKRYLREVEQRGAAVVPTIWLDPGQTDVLQRALEEACWERGFLKPVVGANSEHTLRFQNDASGRAAALAHLEAANMAMMLQPYLEQVETFGEISAIFVAGRIAHGVRKVPVPGDYRVQDDWGASDAPYPIEGSERKQVEEIYDLLPKGLLYARVDLLRGPEGLLCNELELIEPSLFFRHGPETPDLLADALLRWTESVDD